MTALFPRNTPILLTQYVSATTFRGIKPFSFQVNDFTAASMEWILVDFGYDASGVSTAALKRRKYSCTLVALSGRDVRGNDCRR